MEASGEDPNHGVGVAAEQDRLANQRGVAGKAGMPESIAQDDRLRAVGQILLRQKRAAGGGRDAENLEILG